MSQQCSQAGYYDACVQDTGSYWSTTTTMCCELGTSCCANDDGYCCEDGFFTRHMVGSIPCFIMVLVVGFSVIARCGSVPRATSLCTFGIANALFWFVFGLGVAPLCTENAVARGQRPGGGDFSSHYFTFFEPIGDCTTNMIICFSISGGLAFITFLGGICWVRAVGCVVVCIMAWRSCMQCVVRTQWPWFGAVESDGAPCMHQAAQRMSATTTLTPAALIEATKKGTPTLVYDFACCTWPVLVRMSRVSSWRRAGVGVTLVRNAMCRPRDALHRFERPQPQPHALHEAWPGTVGTGRTG